MTEAEWRRSTDPARLFGALLHNADARRLRLLSVALARLTPLTIPLQEIVTAVERFADDELSLAEARAHWNRLDELKRGFPFDSEEWTALHLLGGGGFRESPSGAEHALYLEHDGVQRSPRKKRSAARLIRCIFGDLYRPEIWEIDWPPIWADSTVVALAAGIYADRAFDRLPILADALEDAGCDDEELLDHCREEGPHTRGCWAADLVRWAR